MNNKLLAFANWKKTCLAKSDKSRKGSLDKEIIPLISQLNRLPACFTTSSCAGRIYLWKEPKSGKKFDVKFLLLKHGKISFPEIKKVKLPEETVWLRFEPLILHVCCATIKDAQKLLEKFKPIFKHSGFYNTKNKIILEIRGNEFIEAPIAEKGRFLVDDSYLKFLIKKVNEKWEKNKRNIQKIKSLISF